MTPFQVRVKQSFDASHLDELPLSVGNVLKVCQVIDENWAISEMNGRRGMFPLNHVERMTT